MKIFEKRGAPRLSQLSNDACYQGLKLVSPIYRGSDA